MDIQARIGSIITSRSFCSRKRKASSSYYSSASSSSSPYSPLRLFCSRSSPEDDNNDNKAILYMYVQSVVLVRVYTMVSNPCLLIESRLCQDRLLLR
ncbi:uncharacterized protein LOC122279413 isoform X2 [Carya illinoinensis]|uniref:uncharacterized protein LOC122279413 isoform X2 n=1 Tax=Carya illinoinensis TaxID=32201 RepID=UPI001C71EE4D|nr:uncharacterized protein LOC122279413 isoform X2 [Carya illinoinensis]